MVKVLKKSGKYERKNWASNPVLNDEENYFQLFFWSGPLLKEFLRDINFAKSGAIEGPWVSSMSTYVDVFRIISQSTSACSTYVSMLIN